MAYIPPPGNSVTLNFVTVSTPPDGNNVLFNFRAIARQFYIGRTGMVYLGKHPALPYFGAVS